MRKGIGIAAVALLLAACESGFSQEDIEQAKKSIRAEFEKRPDVKVVEVALIKESSNKLTGYARMTVKGFKQEITKNCSATMGEDRRYIWRCD
jgi:gas vesicle protein